MSDVIHGDCLDVMTTFEPESIDAIVTDPPYGLGFMGKHWDHGAPGIPFWAEMLRVSRPSTYLFAFGGTRTVHRIATAIEDAGWVIRDMLVWAYASGFPKSKASLKPAWEPIVMARKRGPLRMLAIDECRVPSEPWARSDGASGAGFRAGKGMGVSGWGDQTQQNGERSSNGGRWPANVILTDPIFDGGIEGVVGGGETTSGFMAAGPKSSLGTNIFGGGLNYTDTYGDTGTYSRFFIIPKSSRTDREPVLDEYAYRLHRERGDCGKLGSWENSTLPARAISGEVSTDDSSSAMSPPGSPLTGRSRPATNSITSTATSRTTDSSTSSSSIPSPISASTPAASSKMVSGGSPAESVASESLWEAPTGISVPRAGRSTGDAGLATSRSWSSRNVCADCGKPLPRFSTHPTQKPTELMRHLVRLVTPPGGVVLDPFLGSGSTAIACELEGFPWIGIEKEAEYVEIARARLNGTQTGLGLVTA